MKLNLIHIFIFIFIFILIVFKKYYSIIPNTPNEREESNLHFEHDRQEGYPCSVNSQERKKEKKRSQSTLSTTIIITTTFRFTYIEKRKVKIQRERGTQFETTQS
jgi:hypothetical protein